MNDSGKRYSFETGAQKEVSGGNGMPHLIPWDMIERLSKHMEQGAKKYGKHNWQKGLPISQCIDSTMRHLFKYAAGWKDEDHLAAALTNLSFIAYYEANFKDEYVIDVGPKKKKKKKKKKKGSK